MMIWIGIDEEEVRDRGIGAMIGPFGIEGMSDSDDDDDGSQSSPPPPI